MSKILMSKSLSLWLIKNTELTNEQIAGFVGLNEITIASYRVQKLNAVLYNPMQIGMLTAEEITRCENDENADLKIDSKFKLGKAKKTDKTIIGSAVLWLINEHSEITNYQIMSLLKCTTIFLDSIRDGTFKEYDKLIYQNPISLDLCSEKQLNAIISKI